MRWEIMVTNGTFPRKSFGQTPRKKRSSTSILDAYARFWAEIIWWNSLFKFKLKLLFLFKRNFSKETILQIDTKEVVLINPKFVRTLLNVKKLMKFSYFQWIKTIQNFSMRDTYIDSFKRRISLILPRPNVSLVSEI